MKVWIVEYTWACEGNSIAGVFSTKEAAEAYAKGAPAHERPGAQVIVTAYAVEQKSDPAEVERLHRFALDALDIIRELTFLTEEDPDMLEVGSGLYVVHKQADLLFERWNRHASPVRGEGT